MRAYVLALIFAAFLLPGSLFADTYTYTYVGNDFNTFYGTAFSGTDFVSVEFTLDSPLPANQSMDILIDPISFSFTDGLQTITNLTADPVVPPLLTTQFFFQTNSSGEITDWQAETEMTSNGYIYQIGTLGANDFGAIYQQGVPLYEYEEVATTGPDLDTWTVTDDPTSTPEPGSLALLSTGILAMAWFVYRKFGQPSAG